MKHTLTRLVVFISLSSILSAATAPANGTLSLEEAIAIALQSNQMQAYNLRQAIQKESLNLLLEDYAWQFNSRAEIYRDDRETSSAFSPQTSGESLEVGVSKEWVSGTSLSLSAGANHTVLDYPANNFIEDQDYKETTLSITLQQALWRNHFGSQNAVRIEIEKANIQRDILGTLDEVEDLMAAVANQYLDAVLAKTVMDITQESLNNSETNLKINAPKLNSGVLEKRTYYALQSETVQRKKQFNQAQFNFFQAKHQLLGNLSIDQDNIEIENNPSHLLTIASQLKQTLPIAQAVSLNRQYQQVQLTQGQAKIALLNEIRNQNPDVSIFATAAANGIDSDFSPAAKETLKLDHPMVSAGISLQLPLQRSFTKTRIKQAESQVDIQNFTEESFQDFVKTQVEIAQKRVDSQLKNWQYAKEITAIQEKKVAEDRRYFNAGRLDIDDFIRTKDALHQAKLTEATEFINYLKSLFNLQRSQNTLIDHVQLIQNQRQG